MLTQERLKEVLHYDKNFGIFTWLVATSNRVKVGAEAGWLDGNGYVRIAIDGRDYRAHQLAWLYVHGEFPPGMIDHIDRNVTHNWIKNLRPATDAINNQNRANASKGNSSGFLGVSWDATNKCWRAQICVDGRNRHIGRYETPELAHAAYLERKRVLHEGCTI